MTQIPLPQPETQDIYSYGFDKSINRAVDETPPRPGYNVFDETQAQSLQFGAFTAGSTTNTFGVDPKDGIWLGATKFDDAPFRVSKDGKLSALGASTLNIKTASIFETSGRYTTALVGSGAITFGTNGVLMDTGATGSSSAHLEAYLTLNNLVTGSPVFTTTIRSNALNVATNVGHFFCGITEVITVDGGQIEFTDSHIGFKVIKTGGTCNIYATQANGTTETASASLGTFADDDYFDFIFKVNGTTDVDYYVRKNGGTLSTATTLSSTMPTLAQSRVVWAVSNIATATNFRMIMGSFSYER